MTSKQSSYYGREDQYGCYSRYPDHGIRSSAAISPALSSSCPHYSYKPTWNSNYPTKSSYVDGASTAIQAPQERSYYSRPLGFTDSSSDSTNSPFTYNYPATVYGSSVHDLCILRKNIAQINAHTKPKKLQMAKPVKKERLNEEPSNISGVKSPRTFSTRANYGADSYRFRPGTFTIYQYNDIDGVYRIDIKCQILLNPFDYRRGWCNKPEDQTHLKMLQKYISHKDQYSLEDGGRQDLWNSYSNRRCKRTVSNCHDYDDGMQDFDCDYEIVYDCSDDNHNLLNPYRHAKRQKTEHSS